MNCPRCQNVALSITTRDNVEIDYCPHCRGVWLDRGELDKIIAHTDNRPVAPVGDYRGQRRYRDDDHDFDDDFDDRGEGRHGSKRKRKRSLADLFDF